MRAIILFFAVVVGAAAQDYPSRPVRLLVPNAPGSSIDTIARILATRLPEALGQGTVVENRAGAAGALGMEGGKNAAPDGYTVVLASASNLSGAPNLQKSIPYDPLADFAFVSLIAKLPNVLVVYNGIAVKSVKELIEYARANPGKVNMASAGPGAISHLGGVLLMTMAGFESLHVPYKGGGPSTASVVAGETHWTIAPAPSLMGAVRAGRLRAIAQSLERRTALLADLPAVAESVPGYDYSGWAGLIAPKGTQPAVIEKLRASLVATLALADIKEALGKQGAEVFTSTPAEFRRFLEQDLANTARVVKSAGLKPE